MEHITMTSGSDDVKSRIPTDEATLFWKISSLLTGFSDVDRSLSDEYFKVFQREFPLETSTLCRYYWDLIRSPKSDPLSAFISRLKRAQHEEKNDRPINAARQIVSLWLLSE